MRTAATTLSAITLLLGVCIWLTTIDSRHPDPGPGQIRGAAPAVVAAEDNSATVTGPSAPTPVLSDNPTTPPPALPDKPTYPPAIAVRKWLVGELVREGLSQPDGERIVRKTMDKITRCGKVYGHSPERADLRVCTSNVMQESGMSEAFRRLAAKIKAADPGASQVIRLPTE